MAYARESSLSTAQAQENIFRTVAQSNSLGCANIKSSSSTCAESRFEMRYAQEKPPRRLQGKKKEEIMHNKGAEENHRHNLRWGYLCI